MNEANLDVLFGWLIMNIQNHEIVSTVVEYLQSSDSSIDMTDFINLYTQYLISPELVTVERLVVELMKIYDRSDPDYGSEASERSCFSDEDQEGYAQGGPASSDYSDFE